MINSPQSSDVILHNGNILLVFCFVRFYLYVCVCVCVCVCVYTLCVYNINEFMANGNAIVSHAAMSQQEPQNGSLTPHTFASIYRTAPTPITIFKPKPNRKTKKIFKIHKKIIQQPQNSALKIQFHRC